MAERKKLGLTTRIVLGMVLGVVTGIGLNLVMQADLGRAFLDGYLVNGLFKIIGDVFLKSLKMLVVPLVFVSLVCGTCALRDIAKLGRVGGKTVGLYLVTTAIAVTMALAVANLINPGIGFDLRTDATFDPQTAPTLTQVVIDIVPDNPIQAMAAGNMLPIILFAILFGLAMVLAGEPGQRLASIFQDVNEVIMKLVMMLMALAPWGVYALIAKVFATQGLAAIQPLAKYFCTVLLVLALHVGLTYPLLLRLLGRLDPLTFLRKFRSVPIFAFSTSSSNATIPVTLEAVEHRLGVHNSIASFTIPLGATINMDGTAIMQGCATVFIAQAFNVDITLTGYLMVIVTATLASIGTAGVPGVGIIMLAMVLKQVGLPVEGIALIIGVDRLLDMCRTAVNVTGDAVVTCIVARSERELDEEVFRRFEE